jgi:hypothetical protein
MRDGGSPSSDVLEELQLRHLKLEDLERGTFNQQVIRFSHLGFSQPQIAEVLQACPIAVQGVLHLSNPSTYEIIEEHLNGLTAHEIAKRTGFSPTYVYKILKRYQFRPNINRAPELSGRQQDEIIRRWRNGEPNRMISQETGATIAQVKYLVKQRGGRL